MIPEKSKSKNTKKLVKVRRMWGILSILRLYDVLKMFRDFIWLRYCLNWKSKNTNKFVKESHILRALLTIHFFYFLFYFLKNWDFLWLRYCLDKFSTFWGCEMDPWKIQNGNLRKKSVRGLDFHIVSNYTFFVFSIFQPIFLKR